MATRVELEKALVERCINQAVASTKRAMNTATNPIIKQALQEELNHYLAAMGKLTDLK